MFALLLPNIGRIDFFAHKNVSFLEFPKQVYSGSCLIFLRYRIVKNTGYASFKKKLVSYNEYQKEIATFLIT